MPTNSGALDSSTWPIVFRWLPLILFAWLLVWLIWRQDHPPKLSPRREGPRWLRGPREKLRAWNQRNNAKYAPLTQAQGQRGLLARMGWTGLSYAAGLVLWKGVDWFHARIPVVDLGLIHLSSWWLWLVALVLVMILFNKLGPLYVSCLVRIGWLKPIPSTEEPVQDKEAP